MTLQVPHYLGGQYLGALLASCTVFLVYWDALVYYEHDRWVAGVARGVARGYSSCAGAATAPRRTPPPSSPPTPPPTSPWPEAS